MAFISATVQDTAENEKKCPQPWKPPCQEPIYPMAPAAEVFLKSCCCSGVEPLMELIFLVHPGTNLSTAFLWVGDMTFSQFFHVKNFMLHIVKDDWNRLCTHQNEWTFTFPIASYPWHPWKSLTSQLLTLLGEGEKGSSCKKCWLRDFSRKSTFLAEEERFIICSSWWNLIVIFIFCINLIQ